MRHNPATANALPDGVGDHVFTYILYLRDLYNNFEYSPKSPWQFLMQNYYQSKKINKNGANRLSLAQSNVHIACLYHLSRN